MPEVIITIKGGQVIGVEKIDTDVTVVIKDYDVRAEYREDVTEYLEERY